MIPVDRPDVLDSSLEVLQELAYHAPFRGRFVSLYLGLRRMRKAHALPADLGSEKATAASEIERYLDDIYTKTHRPEPFVVLTAPLGGSTSPEAPYSARSGTRVPGRRFPVNTWRNNFGIQKGIGCPAEADVIRSMLDHPQRRLSCPHMAIDPEGRHVCSIRDTAYRGEEHSIWLRLADGGYQVVDLDHRAVYAEYLTPADQRLPVFPAIAMIYCMAPESVFPKRRLVGIPEFAEDFGFSLSQVEELFDCDPESMANAAIILGIEDSRMTMVQVSSAVDVGEVREAGVPEEPTDAILNTGVGAEIAVVRDLESHGWKVRYRANQAGLGYDLEATKESAILRVEVKSSIAFTKLQLEESEWIAAQEYEEQYVLAVVDFYGSPTQNIWYVRNPAANAIPAERTAVTYRLVRADVVALATDGDFL
jgi:hypothetical protein